MVESIELRSATPRPTLFPAIPLAPFPLRCTMQMYAPPSTASVTLTSLVLASRVFVHTCNTTLPYSLTYY